jgi:hypothetical protein
MIEYEAQTIRTALACYIDTDRMKLGVRAGALSAELLRAFVVEACQRAQQLARDDEGDAEEDVEVNADHIARILTQLLLDFC